MNVLKSQAQIYLKVKGQSVAFFLGIYFSSIFVMKLSVPDTHMPVFKWPNRHNHKMVICQRAFS